MNITIEPINIEDDEMNKVTSEKIFVQRHVKDANGNYLFHEDGIFSKRIFGKFGKCECGQLKKPGICPECGCRVISKKRTPNFYTEFDFDLPKKSINISNPDLNSKQVLDLYKYKGFLYDGEFVEYDVDADNSIYEESRVLFGKDAILSLGISEEEYNSNIYRKVSIPHTSYRQITVQGDKYFLGDINKIYSDIIKRNNEYNDHKIHNKLSKFYELNLKYKVTRDLETLYGSLFGILAANHKKNIIENELKGQPETGMIRAVMTNNFSLDEDDLLIGSYFIKTLYPRLYKENTIDDVTDIKAINKILKKEEYLVLFNRQPTIGAKSIIAMHPIFAESDAEKYVIQANPIVYDGLAGDVDGDALNVIALYTKIACEEAKKLLPSVNYVEGSNDTIRNKLPEDFEYVKTQINK